MEPLACSFFLPPQFTVVDPPSACDDEPFVLPPHPANTSALTATTLNAALNRLRFDALRRRPRREYS
ncbi:hypothetical protein I552_2163 [Mycobacterium xenopi 3993]|nr:hypothetical protein I552_2163 [Mycobacterium xenopi 3993]